MTDKITSIADAIKAIEKLKLNPNKCDSTDMIYFGRASYDAAIGNALEILRELEASVRERIKEQIPLLEKAIDTDDEIFIYKAYETIIQAYLNVLGIKEEWVSVEELRRLLEGEK